MKKLVWVAGAVLLFSLVFPDGVSVPVVTPVTDPVSSATPDEKIVAILRNASAADRERVNGIYTGLVHVLKKDEKIGRLRTTEQWAETQAATLDLAVDWVSGAYPGLDVAINNVFKRVVGTDDVLPMNADTHAKLIEAAEIVAASAK